MPRRLALLSLLAALIGLSAAPEGGLGQEAPNLWDVRVELGFNGASGNSSFSILRTGASAKRVQTDRFELDFSVLVRYGKNEEKTIADDAKASVKFDWMPQGTWSPFVFVEAGRDAIRRIDFQTDGGVGAKWTFLQRPSGKASFSLAAVFDYQNFAVTEGSGDQESEGLARWSARFKGERSLGGGASFEHVTFFQPVWNDFGDYIVEVTNTLNTSLVGRLSLALEHMYLHDEVPPPGAAADDQRFSVLLRLAL